jgi:hypothetical protein
MELSPKLPIRPEFIPPEVPPSLGPQVDVNAAPAQGAEGGPSTEVTTNITELLQPVGPQANWPQQDRKEGPVWPATNSTVLRPATGNSWPTEPEPPRPAPPPSSIYGPPYQ